jgi:hypothetical protein
VKSAGIYRMALSVLVLLMLVILSQSLPSAFEADRSGDDLLELESMLSGEHRGSGYSDSGEIYRAPMPLLGPQYDNPNKGIFKNDSIFGDFIQMFDGGLTPRTNQTWAENLFNISSSPPPESDTRKPDVFGRHLLQPILIKEPEF